MRKMMIKSNKIKGKSLGIKEIKIMTFVVGVFLFLFLKAYVIVGGGGSQDPLQEGLVGYWTLDKVHYDSETDTVFDISNNNHGTNHGATFVPNRAGRKDGAMSFDGVGNWVYTSISTSEVALRSSFTISMWIKPDSLVSDARIWGSDDSSTSSNNLMINPDGSVTLRIRTTGSNPLDTSNPGLVQENMWQHIVVTWSDEQARVYLDGELILIGTEATASNIHTSVGNLIIGSRMEGPQDFFHGSIDDVRVYDRALPLEEINLLYTTYDSTAKIASIESGLVGHWRLDEASYDPSTNRVTDSTPYENHGTNYGATFTTDRKGRTGSAMEFDGTSEYIGCLMTNL